MRLLLVAFASAITGAAGVELATLNAASSRALGPEQGVRSHAVDASSSAVNAGADAVNVSSGAVTFTHFFNYYRPSDAQHQTELRLVLRSWAEARKHAVTSGLKLEHLACILEGDSSEGLPAFVRVAPLSQRRFARSPDGKRLPSMAELWAAAVQYGQGRHLIYTNADIGLYPTFYEQMHRRLDVTPEVVAYSITKVILKHLAGTETWRDILAYIAQPKPKVEQHMGHDCFVVPRDSVPRLFVNNSLIIGSPPWGTMYAMELHRQFGEAGFLYLRGDQNQRLTFSLEAPAGWAPNNDLPNQQHKLGEQLTMDEFHLHVCAEAWRVFGVDMFPKACDRYLHACTGSTEQPFPTCELCAAGMAKDPDGMAAHWPADRQCGGSVADMEAFAPLYATEGARPVRHGTHSLPVTSILDWVKAGRPSWHTLDPHRHVPLNATGGRATHRNVAGQAVVAGAGQAASSAAVASCPPFKPSTYPLPSVRKYGPTSRLPVVFVHMHKSGGTVMCHLAYDNGERLRGDWVSQNCNDPQEDIGHLQLGDTTSCETRIRRAANVSYQSLERWLDRQLCPGNFQYATLLRDPLDRMVANFNFARRKMAYARDISVDDVMRLTLPGQVSFVNGQQLLDASMPAYDNFYIRVLCGPDVYLLPAGAIRREHLEWAKARLDQFSVVMTHENITRHARQLTSRLGWPKLAMNCAQQEDSVHFQEDAPWVREILCQHASDIASSPFTNTQMALLKKQNALDYELYCYATALSDLRTASAELELAVDIPMAVT